MVKIDFKISIKILFLIDKYRDEDGFMRIFSRKTVSSGKKITSYAAAAIYIASIMSNSKISQQKIKKIAGISEITLRNRIKEIKKYLSGFFFF